MKFTNTHKNNIYEQTRNANEINSRMAGDASDISSMRFITGSSFEGSWNDSVQMMDGFGSYRYPDGSEYRGRFMCGKFHGFGHLKLAAPYRFTIKGEFQRGKLVSVEDMWFSDGLHVKGKFEKDQFLSSDWDYLTPEDRRYQAERFYGQQPVGPTAYLTKSLPPRRVPAKCFDTEEGLYNASSGWLFDRLPPFRKAIYLGCPQEKEWIMRHCRTERLAQITEPSPSFCRKIIKNNLSTESVQVKDIAIYAPNHEINRKRYFPNVCHEKEPVDTDKPRYQRPAFQATNKTELCLQDRLSKEQEKAKQYEDKWIKSRISGKMRPMPRDRVWTSSSELRGGDSGVSCTISKSKSDTKLKTKVMDFYESAMAMIGLKKSESLYVVQSNMKRSASFVDINRSMFEI
ncbi:uncharacterized protein LOC111595657 [Drosophila hydei]|uniref:Uncharacterized protein LOC111595657 n=1 Tax=Drosophila hydei TaxID=7224 RepID=A0A6J1LG85_DROHY|nr:uncharacterized protein LOC111595657 [Drosophila hydei]